MHWGTTLEGSPSCGPVIFLMSLEHSVSVRGVHAPCSFHNFPPCSPLLSISCPLLLFHFFPCSLFRFLCSLLLFNFCSCSRIFFLLFVPFWNFLLLYAPFLYFLVLLAPGLSFVCSLLLFLFYSLLLAPLCQIRLDYPLHWFNTASLYHIVSYYQSIDYFPI